MNDNLLRSCENIVGYANVDASTDPPSFAPQSEHQAARLVRILAAERQRIRILGAGTNPASASGGKHTATISTAALVGDVVVNGDDGLVDAPAGIPWDSVAHAAGLSRRYLPHDILSGDTATLGGVFSTDASGTGILGYGPFKQAVTGVRAVTATGELVSLGGRTIKNVTGYDVVRFLAGTRGLFALVTHLTLRVSAMPEYRSVVIAEFPDGKTAGAFCGLLAKKPVPSLKRYECVALDGYAGPVTLGLGCEGLEGVTREDEASIRGLVLESGATGERTMTPDQFRAWRRRAAREITSNDLVTLTTPPAAVHALFAILGALPGEGKVLALTGHPGTGRFHLRRGDDETMAILTEQVISLGGTPPVPWRRPGGEVLTGRFSLPEGVLVRALKQELDPTGLFNPQVTL